MKISDIIEKQFNRAFWGYDIVEVDQFLDEIVKEFEHMEQENKLLELRNQMLLDRMARDGVSLGEEDKKELKKSTTENKRPALSGLFCMLIFKPPANTKRTMQNTGRL